LPPTGTECADNCFACFNPNPEDMLIGNAGRITKRCTRSRTCASFLKLRFPFRLGDLFRYPAFAKPVVGNSAPGPVILSVMTNFCLNCKLGLIMFTILPVSTSSCFTFASTKMPLLNSRRFILALIPAILFCASPAYAELVMNVNTSNQTFFFTGSDTATGSDAGYVVWRFTEGSTSNTVKSAGSANSTLSLSTGSFDTDGVWIDFSGTGSWDLVVSTTNIASLFTMTGTGPGGAFSYQSLGPSIVPFEASIGSASTGFPAGTGQSNMTIQGVPEPSTIGTLGILLVPLMATRRRKG
jgi:hypothetical protein